MTTVTKGKKMPPVVVSALRIVITVYIGLSLLVFFIQSSYVYFPEKGTGPTPKQGGMDYEAVSVTTEDGETILGWFVPAPGTNEQVYTVLFCHGNAGNMGNRQVSIRSFYDAGLNVMIFDYRGFGDSTGKPSEKGTYRDAKAVWDYLTGERGIPANRIVLFGRSLGGGVASWLAQSETPAALVLESAFISAPAMAARMFPYLPTRLLCRFKYDNLRRIDQVDCPVVIAHSPNDDSIPFAHGRRLFEAAKEPKCFIETRGGHNDGGLDNQPEDMLQLMEFVRQHAHGEESGMVPVRGVVE